MEPAKCAAVLRSHLGLDLSADKAQVACATLLHHISTTARGLEDSEGLIDDHADDGCAEDTEAKGFATFASSGDYVNLGIAAGCIVGAALAAGLTMSVVSLEAIDLRIKLRTGTAKEKRCAAKLLPLVTIRPHHRLLVTLLLCNSLFNEALPLFLDKLVPSWAAVIVSVTMVISPLRCSRGLFCAAVDGAASPSAPAPLRCSSSGKSSRRPSSRGPTA